MLVAPSESISLPNSTNQARPDQSKLKCGRKQILELRRCAPLTVSCVMTLLLRSNSFACYVFSAKQISRNIALKRKVLLRKDRKIYWRQLIKTMRSSLFLTPLVASNYKNWPCFDSTKYNKSANNE